MKYELNLVDRLNLLNKLPEKGDFITLKIVRKLREGLSLNEEEIKHFNVKQTGDQVSWDNTKTGETKELEIGEKALDIIQETLKKLNESKDLTEREFNLYETFVEKVKEE
jgi:hypothetical protein